MALYSGISVMMTLLAFASLLGLAQGLKCYLCYHHSLHKDNSQNARVDCLGETKGNLEQVKGGEVCIKSHASGTLNGESFYFEERKSGKVAEGHPPAGVCRDLGQKEGDTTGKGRVCSCNDKDGCNGVGGLGSDVNVIIGFGVIALFRGYLRQ